MDLPPVHYVAAPDGVNLAYTVTGRGKPLVMLPLSLNHVQLSWRYDKRIAGWLQKLSERFRLVRYDSRGQGMSTRGLTPAHRIEHYDADLEAVIEYLGFGRFVVLGYSWFSHTAVRYAAARPERVEALILISPAVTGEAWPGDASIGLANFSWDIFVRNFVPDGSSREETERTVGYFHQTATPADFEVHTRTFSSSDVSLMLANLEVPTLVMHPRDFLWVETAEVERVAALIPQARLVLIDGNMAFGDVDQGMSAISDFLATLRQPPLAGEQAPDQLSRRELEVLALLAQGLTNRQIADRLVISINTVARHVGSILSKTGAQNRTEAALRAGERRQATPR